MAGTFLAKRVKIRSCDAELISMVQEVSIVLNSKHPVQFSAFATIFKPILILIWHAKIV